MFSVIIPEYRQEEYLDECIKSVLNQTCQDFEIIVVDDCSPTWKEIDYPKTSVIHHSKNMGLSAARNTGILASNGDYIILLDSDDYIGKDCLERHLLDVPVSVADFAYLEGDNIIPHDSDLILEDSHNDFLTRWEKGLSIAMHAFVFKREVFDKIGLFDETLPNHEDWDFHLRWSKIFPCVHIPRILSVYRIHEKSMCRNSNMELGKKMVGGKWKK